MGFYIWFERKRKKKSEVFEKFKGTKKKESTFALRFMVVYCRTENGVSRGSREPDDEI